MTLDEIKSEVTSRLYEVREAASGFSCAENYNDLRRILTKAIVAVAAVDTADDFDRIDSLLEAVEVCYNNCKSEIEGIDSDETLFEFDFVLDSPEEPTGQSEQTEPPESGKPEEAPPAAEEKPDITGYIIEIEDFYDKNEDDCDFLLKRRLDALRKRSVAEIKAASTKLELIDASRRFRRDSKSFSAAVVRSHAYAAAKQDFDDKYLTDSLKKPNTVRLIAGILAAVGGAAYGLFDARWWPWEGLAWAFIGAGASYLLICAVVALSMGSVSRRVCRRLAFARIILAAVMAVASLVAGLLLEKFGLLNAFIATLPFTLGGVGVYLVYRLRLSSIARRKIKATRQTVKTRNG